MNTSRTSVYFDLVGATDIQHGVNTYILPKDSPSARVPSQLSSKNSLNNGQSPRLTIGITVTVCQLITSCYSTNPAARVSPRCWKSFDWFSSTDQRQRQIPSLLEDTRGKTHYLRRGNGKYSVQAVFVGVSLSKLYSRIRVSLGQSTKVILLSQV